MSRSADVRAPCPPKRRRCRVLVRFAAQSARRRRRTQPPRAARRDRPGGGRRGDAHVSPAIARPHGRHAAQPTGPASCANLPTFLLRRPNRCIYFSTSNAREALRSVETVIVDEIHALVPTKRGVHLMLSLERLAAFAAAPTSADWAIRHTASPRRGCPVSWRRRSTASRSRQSAVGAESGSRANDRCPLNGERAGRRTSTTSSQRTARIRYRPVTIVDAGQKKALALSVQVPVEDMAQPDHGRRDPERAAVGRRHAAVHLGGDPPAAARADSRAPVDADLREQPAAGRAAGGRAQRARGRDARPVAPRLDRARSSGSRSRICSRPARFARSSPRPRSSSASTWAPSIWSSDRGAAVGRERPAADRPRRPSGERRQRGRDLPEVPRRPRGLRGGGAARCTTAPSRPRATRATRSTSSRSRSSRWRRWTRGTPTSCSPHIRRARAVRGAEPQRLRRRARHAVGALPLGRVRRAAGRGSPGTALGRHDHRTRGREARGGHQRRHDSRPRACTACSSSAPAPAPRASASWTRKWCSRAASGETFVLGASSWRIEEITHDRVLVSPAPGEPGKMPFWKGDRAGRPLEFGLAIGKLTRDLLRLPPAAADRAPDARPRPRRAGRGKPRCSICAIRWRRRAPFPTRRRSSIERVRDELGRLARLRLSPRGGRIHAPWAMAAAAKIREERGIDVETLWGDDGFVVRFPDVDEPPDVRLLLPDPDEVQALVVRQLGATALFAAKFRENAARSLLLPEAAARACARRSGSSASARPICWPSPSSYGSFPVLLETYRECLRDFFDMPALVGTLADVRSRHDPRRDRRFRAAVAVCRVAALQLRRQLPVRRRRAAGRTPRAGARRRSGAAARPDRRHRAARAARRRFHAGARAASSSGSTRGTTRRASTASTTCCCRSAI